MNSDLRAKYENGIEIKEAEEVIRQIQEGTWSTEVIRAMESTG